MAGSGRLGQDVQRAGRLLGLVVSHIKTTVLTHLYEDELVRAREAVLEWQTVTSRLRKHLQRRLPAMNPRAPGVASESHSSLQVHRTLDYIHEHFSQSCTLDECARQLRLNPAYLSTQFSRWIGITFKSYLTELRMEKARGLLSHSTDSISEIATTVGYASENRFRLAFKQLTGLPPRRWRDALRVPTGPS